MPIIRPRIAVVGSCNLDQAYAVAAFPRPGETVSSHGYREEAGGKGLNQALAAARFGADVAMIGAVGDDDAGLLLRRVLLDSGVGDTLLRTAAEPTGRAAIVVDAAHENRIVLVAGANGTMTSLRPEERTAIADADALLLQLELPQSVAAEAASLASSAHVPVALTPAPVQPLAPELLSSTTLLFANEQEATALTSETDLDAVMRALLDLVPSVVVTRGAQGSDYVDRDGRRHHQPAEKVTAVDSTAAGDVYAGVYMTSRATGLDITEAMARATRAAAIAVQRTGTSRSIPTADDVLGLLVR